MSHSVQLVSYDFDLYLKDIGLVCREKWEEAIKSQKKTIKLVGPVSYYNEHRYFHMIDHLCHKQLEEMNRTHIKYVFATTTQLFCHMKLFNKTEKLFTKMFGITPEFKQKAERMSSMKEVGKYEMYIGMQMMFGSQYIFDFIQQNSRSQLIDHLMYLDRLFSKYGEQSRMVKAVRDRFGIKDCELIDIAHDQASEIVDYWKRTLTSNKKIELLGKQVFLDAIKYVIKSPLSAYFCGMMHMKWREYGTAATYWMYSITENPSNRIVLVKALKYLSICMIKVRCYHYGLQLLRKVRRICQFQDNLYPSFVLRKYPRLRKKINRKIKNLKCSFCKRKNNDGIQLKPCKSCMETVYCSKYCQKKHWNMTEGHKKMCAHKWNGEIVLNIKNVCEFMLQNELGFP
eukprot:97407_1